MFQSEELVLSNGLETGNVSDNKLLLHEVVAWKKKKRYGDTPTESSLKRS